MNHYVAIVEEEEGKAVGVWFPDLPGCVSAGDTLDEAILNAAEALELGAENRFGELHGRAHPVSGNITSARRRMTAHAYCAMPLPNDQFSFGTSKDSQKCFPA
jgi:predicted RNase H-like HicB family nuclease